MFTSIISGIQQLNIGTRVMYCLFVLMIQSYRFVDVHYQLVPYLLTTGSHAMETKSSSITPLAKHDSFLEKVSNLYYLGR